ncbi:MAG: electron transfer flavoprotein beta subunit/FixA family protein [Flavobacteriales bacterium]
MRDQLIETHLQIKKEYIRTQNTDPLMKILVCLSVVPDIVTKIQFSTDNKRFDPTGISFIINPHDEFCLTKAIMLQESAGAKVDVLTVGGVTTEAILRKALAIGADEAIRIDTDPVESCYVAQKIVDFIKTSPYNLILMGKESIDYNGGIVPALVTASLDYAFVNACIGLDLIEANRIKAVCESDADNKTLSCELPLIAAGQKGLVDEKDLRIPNMRGIMTARNKPLRVNRAYKSPSQGTSHNL